MLFINSFALKIEKHKNGNGKNGNGYRATSPDFPEVAVSAKSSEDALRRARNALVEAAARRLAARSDIPLPARKAKGLTVSLPHQVFLKAVLWTLMQRMNIRRADLARRLDVYGPTVDRLLNIHHSSKPEQIDAAFTALGLQVSSIEITDMAG